MGKQLVTLNSSDMNGAIALTNGNLTLTSTVSTSGNIRATHGKTKGKWYWEVKFDSGATTFFIGIANKLYPITATGFSGVSGDSQNLRLYQGNSGNKFPENTTYGTSVVVGNIIGVGVDLDNGKLEFYKNGISMGVSHTDLSVLGEVFPFFKSGNINTLTLTFNFGATPFAYPIPSGYLSYNDDGIVNKILLSSGNNEFRKIPIRYSNNLIPIMTSNILPNGTASASSFYSTTPVFKAFDGNIAVSVNAWSTNGVTSGWLQYDFPSPKSILSYSIYPQVGYLLRSPKNWTFEGWNSTTSLWEILDTQVGITGWSDNVKKTFVFRNNKNYLKYRINVTVNSGDASYLAIQELEMYENINTIIKIPSQSEQAFLNHGMSQSDLASVDMYVDFTEKHYIQDTSTILGTGKVFEHTLDVNKVLKKISLK